MDKISIFLQDLSPTVLAIIYDPGNKTPAQAASEGINFFNLWIVRAGGLVAAIGAIKLALSLKSEEVSEKITALLTMISGFMIISAMTDLQIFSVTAGSNGETEFTMLLNFIGIWGTRLGAVVMAFGAFGFLMSMKDEHANGKLNGMRTFAAGACVMAISNSIALFVP